MDQKATQGAAALKAPDIPTMYFIGVTTGQSSILKIFPAWAEILGLNAQLLGYDAPLHAPAEVYRTIVKHIKTEQLAKGALVTTHKLDLLAATGDLFDYLDPHAQLCGEVSGITKRDGKLEGYALDPISSGMALESMIEPGYWRQTGAQALILGAGGAAVAISAYWMGKLDPADCPQKVTLVDFDAGRLDHLRQIQAKTGSGIRFECILNGNAIQNDVLMSALPPGSLVINATGMGKDRPGSPVTDEGVFPEGGIAWELNYRGALGFLQQARRQEAARELRVQDGWVYFVHGWTRAVATVFHIDVTPELFAEMDWAAAKFR